MRKFFDLAARANVPANVVIEVTYRCNLKCIHCYIVNRNQIELTIEEYRKLLDELSSLGTLVITITGGEPLIRKDIRDLLEMVSEKGFAIRLFTAGFYLDASFAEFLSKLNILEVEMSIYGSEADVHEYVTKVPGSFEKLVSAAKFLIKENIRTNLKFIAMKHNYREVLEVKKLATSIGANFYYDTIITPKDDLSRDPLKLMLDYEEMREFYSLLRSEEWKFPSRDVDDFICNAGISTMAISPYGEVFPCVQLRMLAGNIKERPISLIWKESSIFKFLRERRLKDYLCGGCPLLNYCNPCIGAIWLEKGKINSCSEALRNRAMVMRELDNAE